MISAMIGRGFLILFCLSWTAIVCFVDYAAGYGVVNGLRAEQFASTTGTITHSEVTEHSGKRGTTYGVDIRYSYNVSGQVFEGDTYRYSNMSSSDNDWAHNAVRAHPVGAPITVHYDADNPRDSVLIPGIEGSDLFLLMFLTPFNVAMLAMWRFGGEWLWHWWNGTKPKLVSWSRAGSALRVRMSTTTALEGGIVATGAAAFVVAFISVFAFGFHTSIQLVAILWAMVIGAGVAAGLWMRRQELAGAYDLVIGDRTVDLPAMFERTKRETVERGAIGGVAVKEIERPGRRGSTTVYEIVIQRRDGTGATIAEWYDGARAEDLAAWLREKLGLRQARA
jgi:hypothetical protein